MGSACITKARTPNRARTNRSFKSLAPRVETAPVSTLKPIGSMIEQPATDSNFEVVIQQPAPSVMEVMQPVMVQQPMVMQRVIQPQPTIVLSQPSMIQMPMQRQSIMQTIAPPVGLVSSQMMQPVMTSQIVPQMVSSRMEILPPRPPPPPQQQVITTTRIQQP